MIYLDAAATTKPHQRVIEAMMPYFTEKWYNPSSLYEKGNKVKEDIEKARKTVADYIGADSNEIFFTSGGSESNCMAIRGFVDYWISKGLEPCVITTLIEHKSVVSCVDNLNDTNIHYVGVDENGFVDLQKLDTLLRYNELHPTLVSIQHANNEIGTIQDIKSISKLVHRYGATLHTDSVQAFGQLPIDVNDLGIDMLSASGHKIYAPKGIGFLYKRNEVEIKPLIYGSQMDGMRGGTENVPYIIGMAKAVKLIRNDKELGIRLSLLRDNFISQLKAIGCKVNGSIDKRLPNNISVVLPDNAMGESILYMLDMSGIFVSTGSACNSKSIEPSYVLKAIGLSDEEANKTIRITLPNDTEADEIDKAVCEIKKQIKLLSMEDNF